VWLLTDGSTPGGGVGCVPRSGGVEFLGEVSTNGRAPVLPGRVVHGFAAVRPRHAPGVVPFWIEPLNETSFIRTIRDST
jgi:hypothetical protein